MSVEQRTGGFPLASDYARLRAPFAEIFARIEDTALAREQQRELAFDAVNWLREAGFGALRVPREQGGGGASLPQLFELLIELAEADSNLPHILRAHFGFVEGRHFPALVGGEHFFGDKASHGSNAFRPFPRHPRHLARSGLRRPGGGRP